MRSVLWAVYGLRYEMHTWKLVPDWGEYDSLFDRDALAPVDQVLVTIRDTPTTEPKSEDRQP